MSEEFQQGVFIPLSLEYLDRLDEIAPSDIQKTRLLVGAIEVVNLPNNEKRKGIVSRLLKTTAETIFKT